MLNSPSSFISTPSGYVDFESNSVSHSWSCVTQSCLNRSKREGAAGLKVSVGPGVGAIQAAVLALYV